VASVAGDVGSLTAQQRAEQQHLQQKLEQFYRAMDDWYQLCRENE
jgi:hypothetical protein